MTFQIAMIGSDGWVLASDRIRGNAQGVRLTSTIDKAIVSHDLGFAYAFAGDDCAAMMGATLAEHVSELKPESQAQFRQWLIGLANNTWEYFAKNVQPIHSSYQLRSVILMLASSPRQFWLIQIGQQSLVDAVHDKWISGDISNAARFFVERYYDKDLRVDQLVNLASQTLIGASKLSPAGVRGLDIVTCKAGVLEMSPDAQIESLTKRSLAADRKIGKLVID